jgi:hypothetical protein
MTSPDSLSTLSCPLCRTVAPTLTADTLAAGGDWRCPRCDQKWSARRLATVAGYTDYCAQRSTVRVEGQDAVVR